MARETKAQKAERVSALLAMFDAKSRELRKLEADVKSMKLQIKDIEIGTYGEWSRTAGTPREILDQAAAKDLLTENGLQIPTKVTEAPIVVSFLGGK